MPSEATPWLEPVEAYRRLRGHGAVLLDGMGAHPEARFAYVALGHAWEARISDGLQIRHDDGRAEHVPGDGMACLRDLVGRIPEGPPSDHFTGGLVGYLGYEFLHAIEPTLPRRRATTPDGWFRLCRDVVVFDRHEEIAWIHTRDLPGEDGAAARMSRWHEALAAEPPMPGSGAVGADWTTSLDQQGFQTEVERLRGLIRDGDLFQANIATRFSTECTTDPVVLYRRLAEANPSPFMALIEADDHAIVSCSPEQLVAVEGDRIRTRPIAGTRRRSQDAQEDRALEQELLDDPKERAEHTMLVDLLRNDVAKVSVPGSVHVPERMSVERYRHVMHLVSRVEGRLREGTEIPDQIAAVFPGGTITGAPKHRACLRIHEAEPVPRGPYTGSVGYIAWDGSMQWNIMIRTMLLQDGQAHIHAGSGIVADSDPEREWQEAGHKARALLEAAQGRAEAGVMDRLGEVTVHGDWHPASAAAVTDRRVLIIDNYDSFTYNLADQCAALGARVRVVRNDGDWQAAVHGFRPTHVILSPGPGRPEHSGASLDILDTDLPVLGVCLGHQAMGLATGARIDTVPPVHGKAAAIHHHGEGLLAGRPDGFLAARYHSLIVSNEDLPPQWHVDAWLEDGTIMAMHHTERPWHGLQFHPESICTQGGLEILRRFLET